jgi:cell wall-associated NlpC family hydrolase
MIIAMVLLLTVACNTVSRYGSGKSSRAGEEKRTARDDRDKPRFTDANPVFGITTWELLKLTQIIQSYLGTPYKGQYKNRGGIDCSQLVSEIFRKFNGLQLPRTTGKQFQAGAKVEKRNLRFGDLVFFRTDGRQVSHVGIYIDNDEFVHASSSNGVIITSLDDKYWRRRLVGCRRVLK